MKTVHVTDRLSRLIPSRYDEPILKAPAEHSDTPYNTLLELDNLTNSRVMAGQGITSQPYENVCRAAFFYGSNARFNLPLPGHGAWYCAETDTAQCEVSYHFALRAVAEGGGAFSTEYTRYSSWVDDPLVRAESVPAYVAAVQEDPNDYRASQQLGEQLRSQNRAGILYASQRDRGAECVALLQPWAVTHIQRHERYVFAWDGSEVFIRRF